MSITLIASLWLSAVAPMAGPVQDESPDRVVVTLNEKALTDEEYVRLVTAIAGDIPQSEWPIEVVRSGDGLERIVDRRYDFYKRNSQPRDPRWDRPMPKTVDALVALIVSANGVAPDRLKAGQSLRVPPIPVRAKTIADGASPVRFYDPRNHAFALLERGRLSAPTAATRRNATRTAVSLSVRAAAELGHPDPTAPPPPPPSPDEPPMPVAAPVGTVAVSEPTALAHIRLLQTSACPAADLVLQRSPYLAAARAILKPRLAELRKRAAALKLVFVDFDFQEKAGHGGKVRSAAEWLLAQLEVPELADGLENFDLATRPDQSVPEHLRKTLIAYQPYAAPFGLTQAETAQASLWLIAPSASPSEQLRTVPPPLLQAALWTHMEKGRWLNLSWEIVSASRPVPVNLSGLLARGSFVTVAAGNERRELDPERMPQDQASNRPQFVNVTYGSAEGQILGTWTGSGGARVDLIAGGCGYVFGRLTVGDRGSSYAAPVVATAAWIRHLLDGTKATAMRAQLARASSLTPPRPEGVIAGGVFDPAKLLANPGPHYVDRVTNQMVALSGASVVTDACGTFPRPGGPVTGQHIIIYQQGDQFLLVHRFERPKPPFVEISDPCLVRQLTATGTLAGQPWRVGSVEDFVKSILHITF